MGSTTSSSSYNGKYTIDPSLLEEAKMYSLNASHTELKHWFKIFMTTTALEHMEVNVDNQDEEAGGTSKASHSSNHNDIDSVPTMRYADFCTIPELAWHPMLRELYEYAVRSEPYFEETRLSYVKFCKLLSVLSDSGSMEAKVRLGFSIIAGENGDISGNDLKRFIQKVSLHLSEDVLNHCIQQIWIEIKNASPNSNISRNISLAEYRRSVALTDDFASKLFINLKYHTLTYLLDSREKRKEYDDQKEKEKKEAAQAQEKDENEKNDGVNDTKTIIALPNLLLSHSKLRNAALRAKRTLNANKEETGGQVSCGSIL